MSDKKRTMWKVWASVGPFFNEHRTVIAKDIQAAALKAAKLFGSDYREFAIEDVTKIEKLGTED